MASTNWNQITPIWPGSEILTHSVRVPEHQFPAAYPTAQTPVLASTLTYGANHSPAVEAADLDTRDPSGKTRLHHAVIRGDYVDVENLLSEGLSLDAYDDDGNQAIHHAARWCFDGIIQLLLRNGAKVNARGPEGKTPLHLAVRSLKAIRSLLKSYPTLSIQDDEGNTALHTLFLSSSPEHPPNSKVLEKLIEAGAKVDISNDSGITPLHLAVDPPDPLAKPNLLLANILLRSSSEISLTGTDNKPHLERLLNRSDLCWNLLRSSKWSDCANETCKLMIRKGASPNLRLKSGELLLHEALSHTRGAGDHELLGLLCENADVEAVALNGDSPLHSLVNHFDKFYSGVNCYSYIQLLIENGANPDQQNHVEETPLMKAFRSGLSNYNVTKMTKTLLEGGADPMISDNARNLPIYVAAQKYNGNTRQSLVQLLAESYAETYSTRPLRSPLSSDLIWWRKYGKLLHDKRWNHATHKLADAKCFPNDIRELLSKLLLVIAAEKILPSTQATFRECKNELGLHDPNTQVAQTQILLILRDCKTLGLDIDQSWYQFLLELFP